MLGVRFADFHTKATERCQHRSYDVLTVLLGLFWTALRVDKHQHPFASEGLGRGLLHLRDPPVCPVIVSSAPPPCDPLLHLARQLVGGPTALVIHRDGRVAARPPRPVGGVPPSAAAGSRGGRGGDEPAVAAGGGAPAQRPGGPGCCSPNDGQPLVLLPTAPPTDVLAAPVAARPAQGVHRSASWLAR